ncbi:MAG: hypothetical protein IJ981_00790 [Clostridia bacterium]|nr:hypothetical protein [Clostridia bacterium]
MNINLKRLNQTGDAIDGTLHINDQQLCDTVENAHTALPEGQYTIVRHFCKQYNRYMPVIGEPCCAQCPQLQDEDMSLNTTMPCVCPMLKPGNGVHHRTDGSIILGTHIIPGCLSHPNDAFTPLAERIRKAVKRNTVITLIITEL